MSLKQVLFSFDGRLRRRDWWVFHVAVFFVNYFAMQVVAPLAFGEGGRLTIEPGTFTPIYPMPMMIIGLGLSLLWLWPNLAVAVKRGHDRNMPARVVLGLTAVTYVVGTGMMVAPALGFDLGVFRWIGLAVNAVIGLYLLVVLGFLDGTPGPNRYGPSPKGPASEPRVADTFS